MVIRFFSGLSCIFIINIYIYILYIPLDPFGTGRLHLHSSIFEPMVPAPPKLKNHKKSTTSSTVLFKKKHRISWVNILALWILMASGLFFFLSKPKSNVTMSPTAISFVFTKEAPWKVTSTMRSKVDPTICPNGMGPTALPSVGEFFKRIF